MKAIWFFTYLPVATATLAPFSALTALLLLPVAIAGVKELRPRSLISLLVLGWLLWLPASLPWSMASGVSLSQAAVLLCLPLGWLVGNALRARGQLDTLLQKGLPILLVLLLIWGLLQGPNTPSGKPEGPFNDPNSYAAILNLLFLPVLARYFAADLTSQQSWLRTAQLALCGGVTFVLFLISSRGATLALILVLPGLFWVSRKQNDFIRKLVLIAVALVGAYFAAYIATGGMNGVGQRLADTIESGDPARSMLLNSAWLMIKDHPWLGSGFGTFQLFYPQYRFLEETGTAGGWVHNDYLQLWQSAGLPMLLLLLGLVLWVVRTVWQCLHQTSEEALLRMGYLVALGAALLHALVNFLFFFALVALLMGLYLAKAGKSSPADNLIAVNQKIPRAVTLAVYGYAFILSYSLIGLVAVESLLGEAPFMQRIMSRQGLTYPRYQVAYWLSVLTPSHPMPQQVMGLETSDAYTFTGNSDPSLRDEALDRMNEAWRRAPCYLPYANAALALIGELNPDDKQRSRGEAIVSRDLECNARHGLSYYYAGWFALPRSEGEAIEWWRAGLAASLRRGDRVMLATAILGRTMPEHREELFSLSRKMAASLRALEANPALHADQEFWGSAQDGLRRLAGEHYLEMVPDPTN